MFKKYNIYNIRWDTDGDKAALRMLPTQVVYERCIYEDELDEIEAILSDYLSDNWGYCHFGFEYEELEFEFEDESDSNFEKQTYCVEIVDNFLDCDPPYVMMQSKEFSTKEEAINWAKNDLSFVADNLSVRLMVKNYTNEKDYDIEQVKL